ncbi:hypothetical protein, conserved [Trypanosoma brucei gambiense DAL972]|uniref:Uncharacterized protein n=1 Tax=Trypanosoma brucei gambiense (strain MHOM/CI/86/DAL972) TaxID=679716 RepID=C9ZMU7_TRYB9|nr:hypothetical protein, conserved [Trypanosoma brucei gambiense DAL972]CBH10600.1 hypothetical protein, conserved [Trypanosoma brucei gambiense DAL972]|eukprot:XP_011772889.1 hypothetical protein, conserved [Trypanosoma brucei gambiense DAL972]
MLRRWSECGRFSTTLSWCAANPVGRQQTRRVSGETTAKDASVDSTGDEDKDKEAQYRERLIQEILSRDKEIFELKRQHELSMLRVEQNQKRVLKDQEDRGMYYEQNCNVHTFDTVSVGLYTQRNTLYHTMSIERLRNVKLFTTLLVTVLTCFYLYYRYMINNDWVYVEKPMKLLGSRACALSEIREKMGEQQEEKEHRERRFAV